MSSGGYLICENVNIRLRLCMYFLLTSSFKTWATWSLEIFSRAERSWIPTMVTPIGQGALPILKRRYESFALWYWRVCMKCTISVTPFRTSCGRARVLSDLNNGFKYSADWTWTAAASFPCVDRLICSGHRIQRQKQNI